MQQEFRTRAVKLPVQEPSQLTSWLVSVGDTIRKGNVLCKYQLTAGGTVMSLKAPCVGVVKQLLVEVSVILQPGTVILVMEERCPHSIVVHDMCADCGANLRKYVGSYGELTQSVSAQVPMIHSIPGIRVSQEEAEHLARQDQVRLLRERKLALIVDLDQTLIHTAISPGIEGGLPDVYSFTLREHPHITYHTRLRPHCQEFLQKVSKFYELHISTMGCRSYADKIAGIIDPEKRFFSSRVISRDECIDPTSKALRLRSVFPCGDRMVAIIDDREDVWGRAPNLIHVKPYMFFSGVADINAPPNNSKSSLPVRSGGASSSVAADSTDNLEDKGLNKLLETEDTETPEAENDGETFQDSLESQSSVVPSSQSTESDKEGSLQSDSSSSLDSDGSSTSSGVSSVNSADGLNQEAEPVDTQLDVPLSMVATASASVNPNSQSKQDILEPEQSSPKSIPDVKSASKQPSNIEISSSQHSKEAKPHSSVSRINRLPSDIQDPDNFLVHLGATLSRIHKIFYAEYDASNARHQNVNASMHINTPDLKEIIPRLRNSVLQDCRILFTGVIPTNVPPERCPEWNTARAFGATIHTTLVGNCDKMYKPTTHLIVGKVGTSKLHEARRMPDIKIVDCSWLWASAESWQHADEALHLLKESKVLHREERCPSWQNKPSSDVREERASSVSVPLISDKELVEMDEEVDAEMDDNDSDSSTSAIELDAKDNTLETIGRSRKRKLSESPQSTSSDIADEDDDELGALLEAQIS